MLRLMIRRVSSALFWTISIVWSGFVIAVFAFLWWWFHPASDIVHTIALPDSPWLIEDRIAGHTSAMNGGYEEIVAKNKKTGKEVSIIVFREPVNAKVSIRNPKQVIITAPMTANIAEKHDSFADISITYNFLSGQAQQQYKPSKEKPNE